MAASKYYSVEVSPDMNHGAATGTATNDGDILFDWTPFEIPKGAAKIVSITLSSFGHDGATHGNEDLNIYFAKSIAGVAPTTLGTTHAAPTAGTTAPSHKNLLGFYLLDASHQQDGGALVGRNIYNFNNASGATEKEHLVISNTDMDYAATTAGYQTFWLAGISFDTNGIWDFGTAIASNEDASANVAANTTGNSVVLKTSGTDPRNVFAPGDIAVGSTGGPTMEVVSVDSATQMTVKNISEQLDNAEIINPLNPFRFIIGFEY
jgi:hypothetical protein